MSLSLLSCCFWFLWFFGASERCLISISPDSSLHTKHAVGLYSFIGHSDILWAILGGHNIVVDGLDELIVNKLDVTIGNTSYLASISISQSLQKCPYLVDPSGPFST